MSIYKRIEVLSRYDPVTNQVWFYFHFNGELYETETHEEAKELIDSLLTQGTRDETTEESEEQRRKDRESPSGA